MADNINMEINTESNTEININMEICNIKKDISELYEKIVNISNRMDNIEQQIIITNIKHMQYDINIIKDLIIRLSTQSTNINDNVNKMTQISENLTQRQLNLALRKSAALHGVPGIPFVPQKTPY